jgi:protein tyrosine/serine phosphatase
MPLHNFSLVDERGGARFYRSAQPDDDGFLTAAKLGVRTVYSLRDDRDHCDIANVKLVQATISMFRPSLADVAAVVGRIEAELESGTSVLVHCQQGRDRTGCVVGAYRLLVNGWRLDAVLAENQRFFPHWLGGVLDPAIEAADAALRQVLERIANA